MAVLGHHTTVWWPNVIIVKYVRFCERNKKTSDKNRKKVEK